MAVQPNLVLGAIGAVIAIVAGAYIGANWRGLTNLDTWEASFETRERDLGERVGLVGPSRNAFERHDIRDANVTTMRVDLTWRDPTSPLFKQPQLTLIVQDPEGNRRFEESRQGGAVGIHGTLQLIPAEDVPTGRHRYDARGEGSARGIFERNWPAHPESIGNWTFSITFEAGTPATETSYSLRVAYEFYVGELGRPTRVEGVK